MSMIFKKKNPTKNSTLFAVLRGIALFLPLLAYAAPLLFW